MRVVPCPLLTAGYWISAIIVQSNYCVMSEIEPASDALQVARALIRLTRRLDGEFRARQGNDGLSILELTLLGGISRGYDLPSVLARRQQLDPSRVTRLTDHLVSAGLIERQ